MKRKKLFMLGLCVTLATAVPVSTYASINHDATVASAEDGQGGHWETIHHEEEGHYETVHHEEVGHYETVHHDAEGHYELQIREICTTCGEDITYHTEEHMLWHMDQGVPAAWHDEQREVWVEDKAAYDEQVWVVDKAAYDEQVWVVDKEAYDEQVWVPDENTAPNVPDKPDTPDTPDTPDNGEEGHGVARWDHSNYSVNVDNPLKDGIYFMGSPSDVETFANWVFDAESASTLVMINGGAAGDAVKEVVYVPDNTLAIRLDASRFMPGDYSMEVYVNVSPRYVGIAGGEELGEPEYVRLQCRFTLTEEDFADIPETPDQPDVPETPDQPETPETPDVPETPETPDAPETPDQPETPETPDQPDAPEQDDNKDDVTDDKKDDVTDDKKDETTSDDKKDETTSTDKKDDATSTDKKDDATSKKPAANTTTEAASSSNMPKTGDAGSMMPLVGSAIASLGAIVTGVRRKFRK